VTSDAPIVVQGLRKFYGGVEAVRGVSFAVARGTIFALVGPDGAGKTTILRSVVSLLSIDEGEILFQGRRVDREVRFVRTHVGYMPQRFSLYQDLTVEENLRFFGDLFAVPIGELSDRIERLYGFSGLRAFKTRRAGALSGGMKQKLALSCVLVHAPEVIVLDEPTFGVDPVSRDEFWRILRDLRDRGTTILVSTAYMDEAHLCDRVGLVHHGRLLAEDTPEALTHRYPRPLYLAEGGSPRRLYEELSRIPGLEELHLFGDGVHFALAPGRTVEQTAARLEERGVRAERIERVAPGLEDLFLLLMKEQAS
jgi:ABC-2 type transport system ATP-binding protein